MTQSLKARFKEAAAETILAAAERVFAEQGVLGARVEDIAAQAGTSVGTLYNHFGDRGGLLAALLDKRRGELAARLDAALEGSVGAPFPAQLEAFAAAVVGHCDEHPGFLSILTQAEHMPEGKGPSVTPRMRPIASDVKGRCEQLMARGAKAGALRKDLARYQTAFFLGMLRGAILLEQRSGERAPRPELAREVASYFLAGAGAGAAK